MRFQCTGMQYLAIASLTGAAYFGSTLLRQSPWPAGRRRRDDTDFLVLFVVLLLRGWRTVRNLRVALEARGSGAGDRGDVRWATIALLQTGIPSFPRAWTFLLVLS